MIQKKKNLEKKQFYKKINLILKKSKLKNEDILIEFMNFYLI